MGYSDVYTLQSLNGVNLKQEFIKAHSNDDWFKKFLYYALNPVLTYNVSEKTLRKFVGTPPADEKAKLVFFGDIFECCEYLSRLRGVDDATLRQVQLLLYRSEPDARELFVKLLAKTLRLGVTAKTVNKIIPHLIPEWEVQQAYPIDKYPVANGTEFWLTQKLNGVRATLYNGQLIARSGVPFKGLDHILKELRWADCAHIALDGELTLADTHGLRDNEAFREATGILNSDDEHKTGICFTIFDAIPYVDFDSANPKVSYSHRRTILNEVEETVSNSECVRVLPVLYHGKDLRKIDELLEQMIREDKEGLMLNTDVPYKRTRHKGILKIKRFYTMDLPITGVEEGSGRLAGRLGAFVLDYKGNEVKVGSGFTDEQRRGYWDMRNSLIGQLCEVKYKEISYDKNTGLESLQFPVFVQLRADKTEVSYG
jgi:DNA ligase-1